MPSSSTSFHTTYARKSRPLWKGRHGCPFLVTLLLRPSFVYFPLPQLSSCGHHPRVPLLWATLSDFRWDLIATCSSKSIDRSNRPMQHISGASHQPLWVVCHRINIFRFTMHDQKPTDDGKSENHTI